MFSSSCLVCCRSTSSGSTCSPTPTPWSTPSSTSPSMTASRRPSRNSSSALMKKFPVNTQVREVIKRKNIYIFFGWGGDTVLCRLQFSKNLLKLVVHFQVQFVPIKSLHSTLFPNWIVSSLVPAPVLLEENLLQAAGNWHCQEHRNKVGELALVGNRSVCQCLTVILGEGGWEDSVKYKQKKSLLIYVLFYKKYLDQNVLIYSV